MKKPNRRFLGSFLMFVAVIGVLFSIFGIGATWYYKGIIQHSLYAFIDSIDQILNNTNDGLTVLDNSLEGAVENLEVISDTLANLNTTVDNISVSLESSADLIGGDLRVTIIDTQTALSSASKSAGLIDNTLRFIAAIPFVGADYQPDVPLSTSLEQVSTSLNDVPEAFLEIEFFIRETAIGMGDLQTDVTELSIDIRDYEDALLEAQDLLSEYELIFTDLRDQLSSIKEHTANFLLTASILITGGFFLLGISQINIFNQGKTYRDGEKVTINLAEIKQE